MRLAFLYDHPEWCIRRTADALVKYGAVDGHSWEAFPADPTKKNIFRGFDIVRIGGIPLTRWAYEATDLSVCDAAIFPTVASFYDLDQTEFKHRDWLYNNKSLWTGLVMNDSRQEKQAKAFGLPLVYSKDRTDSDIFRQLPEFRPTSGPLRVGWAGSTTSWKNVKHVDTILEACQAVPGVTFIRQDRDKDGWLCQAKMVEWLNGLDIYVSINDELTCTPVPQLEAVGCSVPCITTRCGELWPWLEKAEPRFVLKDSSLSALVAALSVAVAMGRDGLRTVATTATTLSGQEAFWSHEPAKTHTLDLVKIVEE